MNDSGDTFQCNIVYVQAGFDIFFMNKFYSIFSCPQLLLGADYNPNLSEIRSFYIIIIHWEVIMLRSVSKMLIIGSMFDSGINQGEGFGESVLAKKQMGNLRKISVKTVEKFDVILTVHRL